MKENFSTLSYNIKIGLARYPNTSVEILNDLAQDLDISIRTLVEKHAKASIEILTNLLEDKDNHVRLAAIHNYQEKLDKLDKYSINSDLINLDNLLDIWETLKNPNQNPKILESQLVRLAKHKNIIIREAVALHPKTPMLFFSVETRLIASLRVSMLQPPESKGDQLIKTHKKNHTPPKGDVINHVSTFLFRGF